MFGVAISLIYLASTLMFLINEHKRNISNKGTFWDFKKKLIHEYTTAYLINKYVGNLSEILPNYLYLPSEKVRTLLEICLMNKHN